MDALAFYKNWLAKEYAGNALGLESVDYAKFSRKNDLTFWWRFAADRMTYQQKQRAKSMLHGKTLLQYPIIGGEKHFAIDYVNYILEKTPSINPEHFDAASQEEIAWFLTKHFQFAYRDYIPWKQVFPGHHYAVFQKAQKDHRDNIKKRGGVYEYRGFRTWVPGFEYGVLVDHCGMDVIPAAALERIKGSLFIDCGAFIGDSSYALQPYGPGAIFAVEPEEKNIGALEENIKLNGMDNVTIINAGVSEKSGEAFLSGEGIGAFVSEGSHAGDRKIRLVSIDDLREQSEEKKIGFIKMDIEGAELGALKGAARVLAEDKPVLSIALYHSGRDFFEIPAYVKKINPDYKMMIVHTNPMTPLFEEYLIAY